MILLYIILTYIAGFVFTAVLFRVVDWILWKIDRSECKWDYEWTESDADEAKVMSIVWPVCWVIFAIVLPFCIVYEIADFILKPSAKK